MTWLRVRAGVVALGAFSTAGGLVYGCASEETPKYGNPDCVPGGCGVVPTGAAGPSTTTSTGGGCVPDAACTVSFKKDIYQGILAGKPGCSKSGCHDPGTGLGGFVVAADAASAYTSLVGYQLMPLNGDPGGPYVVPCNPASSKILCNLQLAGGAKNPSGVCNNVMPLTAATSPTLAQLALLNEWIACGAQDN